MSIELNASCRLSTEERLHHLLSLHLGSRIRDLRVIFQPEGLVLKGQTSTFHVKQLAQVATMKTVDIPILANEIEVHYSSI